MVLEGKPWATRKGIVEGSERRRSPKNPRTENHHLDLCHTEPDNSGQKDKRGPLCPPFLCRDSTMDQVKVLAAEAKL